MKQIVALEDGAVNSNRTQQHQRHHHAQANPVQPKGLEINHARPGMLARGGDQAEKKIKHHQRHDRRPASTPRNLPTINSQRPTGLASSGKMVRLSRSAGICRAAVVMAMTSEEIQISSRQSP